MAGKDFGGYTPLLSARQTREIMKKTLKNVLTKKFAAFMKTKKRNTAVQGLRTTREKALPEFRAFRTQDRPSANKSDLMDVREIGRKLIEMTTQKFPKYKLNCTGLLGNKTGNQLRTPATARGERPDVSLYKQWKPVNTTQKYNQIITKIAEMYGECTEK